jgi:hypothetical protein
METDFDEEWSNGEQQIDTDEEDVDEEEQDSDKGNPEMDEDPEGKTNVHQRYVEGDLVETAGEEVDDNEIFDHVREASKLQRLQTLVQLENLYNRIVCWIDELIPSIELLVHFFHSTQTTSGWPTWTKAAFLILSLKTSVDAST